MIGLNQVEFIIGKNNMFSFEKFMKGKTYCHPNLFFKYDVETFLVIKYGYCSEKCEVCDTCAIWKKFKEIIKQNEYR